MLALFSNAYAYLLFSNYAAIIYLPLLMAQLVKPVHIHGACMELTVGIGREWNLMTILNHDNRALL